jgi:N-acetylglucosamine-6-phosphate deacetylase
MVGRVIVAGRVRRGTRIARGWVEVEGERVSGRGWGAAPRRPDVATGGIVARGLVDLQVNGAAGAWADGGTEALERMARTLLARGVTSLLPTILTGEDEHVAAAVAACAPLAEDPSSPVEGVHLEGPFLSPSRPGAHRRGLLRAPQDGVPAHYAHPAVRLVTLAPELPGALGLCADLAARGVLVSIGHTEAPAAVLDEAAARGARMVTHLFNAMPPLHHRVPGPAGWALASPLALGVIADGAHVDPLVLRLVHRAAGGRVVLVSDATAGAPGGEDAARTADGVLAGSTIALDEALGRWRAATGAEPAEALAAASARPARLIGLDADLAPGAPADLVVLDGDLDVERVMKRGRWVDAGP